MVNTAPDFVMNSCSEGGRTSCIVRRRYSASDVTLGLADPLFAGWDKMPPSTSDGRRRALLDAIARKQHELEEFERRREVAKRSLAHLRAELQALDGPQGEAPGTPASPGDAVPLTGPEKVALFRSLFRGRDDVFPVLWTSSKTGRTGYSPACDNEWAPGVCEKPRVRCGECPNQAFVAVSDRVILDHLRGRHVAGVYPLLADETCWFLAADFDKGEWKKDVAAFRDTCNDAGLPVAVERSRSGNGAHAWFFFDAPVSAAAARRMGCYLITQAMSRRHGLDMTSYDRLFPNQDTMPRGGFGNLIALPLQHGPRAKDNTVFVDEEFAPFPDQWAYLAGVQRIPASTVERVAADAQRSGQVLGVRTSGLEEEDAAAPWLIPPSRRSALVAPAVKEPVPTRVEAALAQRLFISKADLPSSLINALSRIAAFQNPDFYEKQRLRLSTARIPRIICRAEDFPRHVALPRGCVDDATALLQTLGATLEIDDQREDGHPIEHRFHGMSTELQEHAVRALQPHDIGVLVAPPGVGKTVAGIRMIAERARNTLVLVHLRPLLEQWVAQLAMFLDVDPRTIGRIGAGKRRATGVIDVATFQSLVRGGTVADLVAGYGHVVVDECHHGAASSFEQVLSEVRARYVTGLTATPKRRDGQHPIFEMQLGPARHVVDRRSPSAVTPFARRLVVRETEFELTGETDLPIQRIYRSLAGDERRNDLILNDVIGALDAGRSPLVLTERKDHLDFLAGRLRAFTRHLIVLQGGVGEKKRREALAALAAIPDGEEFLVLATGRYIGEGFDEARLDTLFLTMPVSWRGTVVQYTGRLHRLHPDKTEVRIYDYVDRRVPVLARMYKRRLTGYRAIGYERSEETML